MSSLPLRHSRRRRRHWSNSPIVRRKPNADPLSKHKTRRMPHSALPPSTSLQLQRPKRARTKETIMRKIVTLCFALLTLCFVHGAFAQEAAKAADTAKAPEAATHYYHLDFVVQEVGTDGKPVNSRSYTSIVSTGTHDSVSIRADSRIPIVTSSFQSGDGKENRQYQWQNIGVHIDAGQAHEIGRQLALNLVADIS